MGSASPKATSSTRQFWGAQEQSSYCPVNPPRATVLSTASGQMNLGFSPSPLRHLQPGSPEPCSKCYISFLVGGGPSPRSTRRCAQLRSSQSSLNAGVGNGAQCDISSVNGAPECQQTNPWPNASSTKEPGLTCLLSPLQTPTRKRTGPLDGFHDKSTGLDGRKDASIFRHAETSKNHLAIDCSISVLPVLGV